MSNPVTKRLASNRQLALKTFPFENRKPEMKTFAGDISGYEMSKDGNKLLIAAVTACSSRTAGEGPAGRGTRQESGPDGCTVKPREECRQMFVEAWRLERDYFYDPACTAWTGVDRDRHLPLVGTGHRPRRAERPARHGGRTVGAAHLRPRRGHPAGPGSRRARYPRGAARAGRSRWRLPHRAHLTQRPRSAEWLLRCRARSGGGRGGRDRQSTACPCCRCPIGLLLRSQAGQQVLLRVKRARRSARTIVVPIALSAEDNLRYDEWEYTRRLRWRRRAGATSDTSTCARWAAVTSLSGPRLLPGVRSRGTDHRRAPQPRREHR